MSEKLKVSIQSRESDRREIASQVQAFLSRGGHIERLPQAAVNAAPIGNVWRSTYVGGIEGEKVVG